MTKNPRDHREWTGEDLQADPAGYNAARDAYHEDQAAEKHKQREEAELEAFSKEFVRAGGERKDAREAWKEYRNRQAAEAAIESVRRSRADSAEYSRREAYRNV